MSLAPRLDLRQAQSLVMTPQLQQALKLLTLSNLELEGFLQEAAEANPLLSLGDAEGSAPPAPEPPAEPEGADRLVADGHALADAPLDRDLVAELGRHDSAADGGPDLRLDRLVGAGPSDGIDWDQMAGAERSLADHLLAQAGEQLAGPDLLLAAQIIDAIDEAGYLAAPLTDIAARLGVTNRQAEAVLAVIQGFDPTGVGARSLGECLALQAREADRYDPAMARLLDNLPMLADGRLAKLKRLVGLDEEDFADMLRELRGYQPKPGLRFGTASAPAIVPDLFVRGAPGRWRVELNGATLPRLSIDRAYANALAAQGDKRTRGWLSEQRAQASFLSRALDQRADTLLRVGTEIAREQAAFFTHGVSRLKPLTMKAVADRLEMHDSTVSRTAANKWLSCDRGTFELRWFFTSGVGAADGEAAAAEAVKSAIAKLIANEGAAILSDDRLVELLAAQGFDLARRTVAKYREAIGLGSSHQRRRQKALG
jgi:RNA polymerase sigma-54 factor